MTTLTRSGPSHPILVLISEPSPSKHVRCEPWLPVASFTPPHSAAEMDNVSQAPQGTDSVPPFIPVISDMATTCILQTE